MIGVYDYTVILTYISLITSIFGMTQAIHGRFRLAIICLAISGLCDMFDGKIARTKKNRTEDEKSFGIQLDSLCDVVCFGAFPALIGYLLGMKGTLGLPILFIFCVCAVIRLAWFNVLELKKKPEEASGKKIYHGLPITSSAIVLPVIFMIQGFCSPLAFQIILHAAMLLTGILYIVDFPVPKPNRWQSFVMVAVVAAALVVMIRSKFKLQPPKDDNNAIIEQFIGDLMQTEKVEEIHLKDFRK